MYIITVQPIITAFYIYLFLLLYVTCAEVFLINSAQSCDTVGKISSFGQ